MYLFVTLAAIILVMSGVFVSQKGSDSKSFPVKVKEGVLSEKSESQDGPSEEETVRVVIEDKEPTSPITQRREKPKENKLSSYQYPQSNLIESVADSLILTSVDHPDLVTDWYKDKIISEGVNVKTFVKTKANDSILNKLVGVDDGKEIRVEIEKKANSSLSEIKVSLLQF